MATPTSPKPGSTLDQLAALKARTEAARRERAEAEGALKEVERRLREEFECSSISAAEAMLATEEAGIEKDEAKVLAALAAYEKQFEEATSESTESTGSAG